MIEYLTHLDRNLFLFLNSKHNHFFDALMWLVSDMFFWIPLYIWFLWELFKRFRTKYWTVILSIFLLIFLTDQACNLSKATFMRLRPTHEPQLMGLIHTLNGYKGGLYSFYSGHSANAFALAIFFVSSVRSGNFLFWFIPLIYAALTAYSRIYLGVHYPSDIVVGALVGGITGYLFARAHQQLRSRFITSSL